MGITRKIKSIAAKTKRVRITLNLLDICLNPQFIINTQTKILPPSSYINLRMSLMLLPVSLYRVKPIYLTVDNLGRPQLQEKK